MTSSPPFVHTSKSLEYVVTHVFLPVHLPEKSDYSAENNRALARAVCAAAHAYAKHVCGTSEQAQWHRVTKMLDNLQASVQSEQLDSDHVISQLRGMQVGDILVFSLRCQNAAIVFTKGENCTICEAFEASPSSDAVAKTAGPLICSYPGSAAEMPNAIFHDGGFQLELAKFLSRCDADSSDVSIPLPNDPQYIGTLLTSILQSIGRTVNISHIPERAALLKRTWYHAGWSLESGFRVEDPWHRSPLWLLIRVAIQMSVSHDLGRPFYKQFVLFFTCTLAGGEKNTSLSSDLLHLMSSRILRRLSKLGPSTPDWLSETALKTFACLREILDNRWKQLIVRRFPFRNPSQDELARDTQASLLGSNEYIRNALADPVPKRPPTPFRPSHHRRGTIDDFLSSNGTFFDEAYDADPDTTLYDVERCVEQGIDDWLARVANVDEACAQLETLMDQYMMKVYDLKISNPEDRSKVLLTGIELYVALDKLVVQEIPMLVDYPPDIPIALLERLFLRNSTSLHRLSCAYRYLAARHSQSHPGWSVLSNDFTEESFPIRYYNQSPRLQRLKARIDEDAMTRASGHAGLEKGGGARLTRTHDEYQELAERTETSSPLPASPLHGKAIVFELGCPTCFRILRAAAPRILNNFKSSIFHQDARNGREECHLVARVPALQPYHVERQGPSLHWQAHLAYAYVYPRDSKSPNTNPALCYAVQYPTRDSRRSDLSVWRQERYYVDEKTNCDVHLSTPFSERLGKYHDVSHTSNDVMATQARCPADLSLDEFVAFAHLRNPQSLQWLNILHGLRSRTLNLRHWDFHYLLAYACLEVGPLDLSTGTWIWHQELQESSFCNNLLDELERLLMDVGAGATDSALMSTISLFLTRVLASSPGEDISERVIALLRRVRKKTFGWMQVFSYDLAKAPTHSGHRELFRSMTSACRSTFDGEPATLRKLLHSAEDVDALLSCAFLMHALGFHNFSSDLRNYSIIHDGDRRLSPALADILKDVILADASDYGIDLAVGKIFPIYRPGICRWGQWQHPDSHWLSCNTETTVSQSSQMLHVNLHDAVLRVGDQLLGGLPREVKRLPGFREIFCDQGFWIIPSNLPGMDFTTFNMSSKHKVHFSLRDGNLVLRAQCNQSNEILQLIPSGIFQEDLPPALIDGYVHWLNLSTKIIEIRPLEQLWEDSPENWRIDCASRGYRVYKGRETLVDIRSPTWAMVFACFACINDVGDYTDLFLGRDPFSQSQSKRKSKDILVTTSLTDSVHSLSMLRLCVTLSRYGLSFFVNDKEELESWDFGEMVCDENQSIGALFGLENLLVLRPKSHLVGVVIPETLIHRRIVIPSGHPTKHVRDHRVRVLVQDTSYELYHTYEVDAELGCLIGNGSLLNTAFLAHLHVMTNYHRPDPLTGKTGAQAALCLLQSGVCRSVMKPKVVNREDIECFSIITQYPQINAAYRIIQNGFDHGRRSYFFGYSTVLEWHAARRAAYLFPFHANGPAFPGDCDCNDSNYTTDASTELGLPTLSRTVSSLRYVFNLGSSMQITLNNLICNRPAPELPDRSILLRDSHITSPDDLPKLDQLFHSLRPDLRYQREYIAHLETSAQHASMECRMTHRVAGDNLVETLKEHYEQCRVNYLKSLDILIRSLGPTTDLYEQALDQFGQWPPVTADVLLRYLSSTSPINIPPRWKKCLTSFALLLLDLQRARRLLRFALDGLEEEFSKELENEGCDGWSAEEYPDWLLIQIQGNFLIRRTQAETAMELISPQSGENTVMQLNMGEGKSSVIIPIAASVLADGKQLVRIIVPKSLAVQMFELLASRLGGLTNRHIYYLPFSRTPEYNRTVEIGSLQIDDLLKLMSQCMTERGIVLLQPEHVASLKLMTVEQQICEGKFMADLSIQHQPSISKYMKELLSRQSVQIVRRHDRHSRNAHGASDAVSKWLSLQKWLYSHVRDILDENDQILHTRFQLVYTVGNRQHMDGYPDRWTIAQQVLKLVKKHIYSLSRYAPDSVECKQGPPGSFPHARILRASDVGPRLISLIVEDVMYGRIPGFDFRNVPPALQNAIRSFISDEDVLQIPDTAKRVEEYAKDYSQSLWSGLLQLRGLLTSNILLLALAERRWRVDYGSALWMPSGPTVTDLAVPYRAKDVPFPNTQFGHPDLTIILTCLCYYYTGLTEWDLTSTFEILLNQNDPFAEYALWIEEYDRESVPDCLRILSNINLGWSEQWVNVIFPYFAHNRATIDFYLSRVVFPKEAMEYPWKLSASSWDLAEKRRNLITGMSGTSDERWLLPMSIAQRDLDHQKGTDARVLAYLLQPENNFYMVTQESGKPWSTHTFLRMVVTQLPEVCVLLDVGSQILDLSNREVAETWLGIASGVASVIYFNDSDELKVLTRNGITQPAQSSPLFQQLDRCIVYLDHAHTRGTDIRLPIGSRAAVTLGPKVTKDALVQGCMRMRKLGHGHSVMFFAPPDVDRNIRATVAKTDPDAQVTTVDVLCWAIHETWTHIQHRAPHWAQQGMDHRMRSDAWIHFADGKLTREKLADAWLQPELKSLADLYAPCQTKNTSSLSMLDPDIRQRCKDLGILSLPKARMEEEQEREICREQEREREVELPPRAKPAQHFLHPDVVSFVRTGVIPPPHSSSAFQPIFATLDKSSAAADEADVWSPFILATTDFYTTIEPESTSGTVDQYLRPVQWILSSKRNHDQILVLLSPFEVDRLMPDIRASEHVHLHLYAPRTSQRMRPSDDLKLYSIPPLPSDWTPPWTLVDQLNVFAGQLYLRDYQSYLRLCRFLGVPTKGSPNDSGAIRRNLFNIPGSFEEMEITFSGSPLPFVMALLAMRRRGITFAHTHMGKILQGQILTEKDFQQ